MLAHRFQRFLASDVLHFAAHSHHLWPDVTLDAHQEAWNDAALHIDEKWDRIFGEVLPQARSDVAALLGLGEAESIVFAPNTHELVTRIASCLPTNLPPAALRSPTFRIVTTDAEFHSFRRQALRWEEADVATVIRVPAEPFSTFAQRFAAEAAGGADLVYLSHVLFDSGYFVSDLELIVDAIRGSDAFVVVDGYHAVMALPVDISFIAERIFYLGGGYKYAMAGEGACYLHCPPGWGERPVNTGWYAGFSDLTAGEAGVGYAADGSRFFGSTFDPSGLYRFTAVQKMLRDEGVTVADIHAHVRGLQSRFVEDLGEGGAPLGVNLLVPGWDDGDRGHFLTFRTTRAGQIREQLREAGVITDHRGDRLRIGFGVYHDDDDVQRLLDALSGLA